MNNAPRSNSARKGGPKKSNGQKKANGGVNIRQATSSLSAPSTSRGQYRSGMRDSMAPTSIASQQRQRGPASRTREDGKMIVIRRRELIASVIGSQLFSISKYSVNPGIAATFPLLSIQAPQWEQYRFRRLAFEYITRTATTTVGSVILAPDYDAEDTTPTTEAQITGYNGAVEDAPWKNITCVIDCNSVTPGPRKYIRSAAVAGDIKNYDALNFYFATVDMANANGVGKLWVDYEVELSVPQNSPNDTIGPKTLSYFRKLNAEAFTSTVNKALYFDPAFGNNDPLGFGPNVLGVYTPPAGVYKIEYGASFSDFTPEVFTAVMTSFKNGAASGPSTITIVDAGETVAIVGQDIIRMNGTDTFELMVNLTGAAGALSYVADSGYLMVSVV